MTDSAQIVYISCVEEVRFSFVSHLSEALYEKGIRDVFVDSKDLFSEEAQEKVERARVAVMVLPGNRTVFLDKLKQVLECQKNKNQVVVPVLYGDIPLQDEWHSALDSEGLSSVHRSSKECSDSELVDEIVKDVYEKLFCMERIGIYSKLLEIESMVCKQPFGVRFVGIWGMPGIGKTTLAKAVFNQMLGDFDVYCFIEDHERAIHEKGLYRLFEEQFSKKKPGAGGSITKLSLLSNKLNNKRVLVVLDDVRDPLIVEPLFGGFDWFGPESLIIITSRDKQVFRLCRVNQIYEVQGLNEKEALQLFLLSVSIENKEEVNLYHELSMKVIEYANGNPLALSIYGRELKGKKEPSEMETAFRRPPSKVVDAINSSYDTLSDSEKNIFLDIACFFNGENVDYVMQLLEGCGFFPHVGIDVLVGKSLVTVSDNRVWMHNLIQEVGREIINGETVHIERRSRLWKPCIKHLLEDNERAQDTKEIEGMFLDTSNLSFDINPAAFENMLNLRLLKIYYSNREIHPVINFPNGSLHSLPNDLRLLHWENYSMKNLPQKFDPRHLVEINMPHSQLVTLWGETKNLEMLRTIKLCHSQQLVDVTDLLQAKNLEVIDLQDCKRLQSFPAAGKLLHLRVVNLSGCSAIKSFPEIPPNIETLLLQGTGIIDLSLSIAKPNYRELLNLLAEIPGLSDVSNLEQSDLKSLTKRLKLSLSNQDLGKLICLDLKDCSCLRSLPDMVNLELLRVLDLSGCSKLETIQGFPRNLKELNLAGTVVREVPQLPQSLELFNAHGCVALKSIHLDSKKLPMRYTFSNCFDLSPHMFSDFLVEALANAKHIPRERQQELNRALAFSFCSPSHEDQNYTLGLQPGSSVMIRLNPSWKNTILGFAMLVEVDFSEDYCDVIGLGISCVCRWKNTEGNSHKIERNLQCWAPGKAVPKVQKDHIFVFVDVNMRPSTDEENDPNILADLVVFEFFPVDKQNNRLEDSSVVRRCGVRVITAETGNTILEDISPVFSWDPIDVSGNQVEEDLRASYDGLLEMDKDLFLYITCLFNDEDDDMMAPFNAAIDLDVGLKVLADRSLIRVSSHGEIVMNCLVRRMGKELLLSEPMLPGSSKKIERLVGNSQNSMINARKIEIPDSENPQNYTRDTSYVPRTSVPANAMEDFSLKGFALGNLVLSSGLLHSSWSKISVSDPNQDLGLEIKTYEEAKYTFVVFVAQSTGRNSSPPTLLHRSTNQNPFHFLCSENISSFRVHTPALHLFESAYNKNLPEHKSKLLKLLKSKKRVIITGADLGGAVASLFTLWLLETIDPKLSRPLCITFGSPLIGDASLQQVLENSVRNSCFLHVDVAQTHINEDVFNFKPFGTFLICFDSECICIDDPVAVMELLVSDNTDRVDWRVYGEILRRLDSSLMADSRLMIDDVIDRMEERAKNKQQHFDKLKKLNGMKLSLIHIEWYKKISKMAKIGYYDRFKTRPMKEEDIDIEKRIKELNLFWKSMVEEVEKKPQSEESILKRRCLFAGNNYRRIIEPLEIAEYYLNGKNAYRTLGRSRHYVMLEKWFQAEKIEPVRRKNGDLSDLLTFDSCFWAEVEESLTVINSLKATVGMRDKEPLARKLVKFEEYVWRMIQEREVSPEIFLEKSSFMRWWREYKMIRGFNSPPSTFTEYMNAGKYESYGQPIMERSY